MKATEELKQIRSMKVEEINKELQKAGNDVSRELLGVRAGKVTNFSSISKKRTYVARLKTVLREKEGSENE